MKSNEDKVLIIVGDASETVDTLYPYYRLQESQFVPVVAGPKRQVYQMVLHEVKPGWTITKEWEGYTIKADVAFSEVNPDEYMGIFFSGGRAPSTSATTRTWCGSRGISLKRANRFAPSAMAWKYPPTPIASGAGGWRRCPSASSIWKCAAGFSSTSRASLTAIWLAGGRIMIMGILSANGSSYSLKRVPTPLATGGMDTPTTKLTLATYDVWRECFGQTAGSGNGSVARRHAAGPEPATALMLIVGILAMLTRRCGTVS